MSQFLFEFRRGQLAATLLLDDIRREVGIWGSIHRSK